MDSIKSRIKLFHIRHPYISNSKTRRLFTAAVRDNCLFHYENCAQYNKILMHYNFHPKYITSWNDLQRIPPLPTALFKTNDIHTRTNLPPMFQATSSGTGGQFSRIDFDAGALVCGLNMVIRICGFRRLFSLIPAHYIILGSKPDKKNRAAAAKTALGATFFTPALSRTFAINTDFKKSQKQLDKTIDTLIKLSESKFPIRFVGFPSYTYFLLKQMEERRLYLHLKPGSKILIGGGWKQFHTQQVDKKSLYGLAGRVLGISEDHIIEFFSAVEHPILYCDCKKHHFHVPVYSQVIIRDVRTLKPLPYGSTGLVNLITPMLKATPIVSIMTDDLGILHPPGSCGNPAPYLELLGRVGLTEIKTCAATANELITEVTK